MVVKEGEVVGEKGGVAVTVFLALVLGLATDFLFYYIFIC